MYRCETDGREIVLNDEHDAYTWLTSETAVTRLAESFVRFERAVKRAVALDTTDPFTAVIDPYADTDVSSEPVLEQLAELRNPVSEDSA